MQEEIKRFEQFNAAPRRRPRADDVDGDAVPDFLNGRTLRSYQLVSLAWMVNNWRSRRNCILGDEMCACPWLQASSSSCGMTSWRQVGSNRHVMPQQRRDTYVSACLSSSLRLCGMLPMPAVVRKADPCAIGMNIWGSCYHQMSQRVVPCLLQGPGQDGAVHRGARVPAAAVPRAGAIPRRGTLDDPRPLAAGDPDLDPHGEVACRVAVNCLSRAHDHQMLLGAGLQ